MKDYFCDTSAILKHYCKEAGSSWVTNIVSSGSGNVIYLAEITMAEFGSAVAIKHRTGTLTLLEQQEALNLFLSDCDTNYVLVGIARPDIRQAVELTQKYILRGYDAVQLATALNVKLQLQNRGVTDFTFVTADNNLIAAATAEGLTVENPNNHP